MRRLVLGLLAVLFFSACVGTLLPHVSPTQAEWAMQHWPDMNQEKITSARSIYVNRCSGCHNIILPSEHSLEKWDIMISSMAERSKLRKGEQEMIWRYISTVKRSAPDL